MPSRPEDIIRDEVRAIASYHVADPTGMVKLDAMENPYLLPDDVRNEIAAIVSHAEINRYPDPAAGRLKSRLRLALAIPQESEVILGNGSDEIIQMLMLATAKAGATVLSVAPTFVMFRLIATYCGMRYASVSLNADFSLDGEAMLAAIEEHQPALVFLAYPNNPTGNLFDDAVIDRLLRAAPGLVVIDEAYHAFAGRSYMKRLGEFPNLLVMRTVSKSGLAGLRLGLVAGSAEWLQQVDKVRLPYNIGVLTQVVAEQALQHQSLLDEQASAIRRERTRLARGLAQIPATTSYPSEANFILFRTAAAERIVNGLKQHGVLVKSMHGSHPLLDQCVRVTVGTPQENDRFLDALRAVA